MKANYNIQIIHSDKRKYYIKMIDTKSPLTIIILLVGLVGISSFFYFIFCFLIQIDWAELFFDCKRNQHNILNKELAALNRI